jgi:trafficking protein particle complex subunit 9
MASDPFSPTAPARIRAILLPVGRVKRSAFRSFVDLLQPECMVRLGDVSPDPRPHRSTDIQPLVKYQKPALTLSRDPAMFSPLAFPNGRLLYDFSTSLPSAAHLALAPFELFREPLLVLGIADANEYDWAAEITSSARSTKGSSSGPSPTSDDYRRDLKDAMTSLREQFSKALVHRLLLFNSPSQLQSSLLPEDTISVPPAQSLKTTSIKTIMCDLTALLLAEMTALAKSFQALPTVNSPASPRELFGEDSRQWAVDQPSLSRRNSQMAEQPHAGSPSVNSNPSPYRMSMPVQLPSGGINTPNSESILRSSSPPTGRQTPPAKSFDEMPGLSSNNSLSRSSSISSRGRASVTGAQIAGQEKVSVHGFGSGSVSERARNKGKCRIGILVGSLYLCAGRWNDALKELSEYALNARALSDHLWHAKALENMLVCLLLLAWRGMDFQVSNIPISLFSPAIWA